MDISTLSELDKRECIDDLKIYFDTCRKILNTLEIDVGSEECLNDFFKHIREIRKKMAEMKN
jgi:hypothetical protein